jgi:hypothetical protein
MTSLDPGAPRKPRRRSQPARTHWMSRAAARTRFLMYHLEWPEFRAALLDLYAAHVVPAETILAQIELGDGAKGLSRVYELVLDETEHAPWASDYLAAIAGVANRFGLNRLRQNLAGISGHYPASEGEELIHIWCRFQAAHHVGLGLGPDVDVFHILAWPGGISPPLGESGTRVAVRIEINTEWDPSMERPSAVKARLRKLAKEQIDAQVQDIVERAEGLGYEFPDTHPKAGQHIHWLFEHVALGKSWGDIAQEWLDGRDLAPTVYNGAKPYADQIGVVLGPAPSPTV